MSSPVKNEENNDSASQNTTWLKPNEVIALHRLKSKKRALQARIKGTTLSRTVSNSDNSLTSSITTKRKNPFMKYV